MVLMLVVPAFSQDEITSESGPVEVEADTAEDTVTIPVDEESGMVNWDAYLSPPEGGGASWGFITMLYPPDPAALADCPEILLDGAWYPPIPFSYGYEPSGTSSLSTVGFWYLESANGYLARRSMDISDNGSNYYTSTWFVGGASVFHIEEAWTEGFYGEGYYLPDEYTGAGIDYFLKSIWFRGIVTGERMQVLLDVCGAVRIGRDMMNGGRDPLMIFQIPANETDRQNGRGSLLVWVKNGTFELVRTRLHAAYAIEMTEFQNLSPDIEVDPSYFYSEYIPGDLYWSIDQYLLTKDTSVFGLQFETTVEGREVWSFEDEEANTEGIEVEVTDEESGDSEEDSSEAVSE